MGIFEDDPALIKHPAVLTLAALIALHIAYRLFVKCKDYVRALYVAWFTPDPNARTPAGPPRKTKKQLEEEAFIRKQEIKGEALARGLARAKEMMEKGEMPVSTPQPSAPAAAAAAMAVC